MNSNIPELNTQIENLEATLEAMNKIQKRTAEEIRVTEDKIARLSFYRERAELYSFVASFYKDFADDEKMYQKIGVLETLIEEAFSLDDEGKIPEIPDYLNCDFSLMGKEEKANYLKELMPEGGSKIPFRHDLIMYGETLYFMNPENISFCNVDRKSISDILRKIEDEKPPAFSKIAELMVDFCLSIAMNKNPKPSKELSREVASFMDGLEKAENSDDVEALKNQYEALKPRMQKPEEKDFFMQNDFQKHEARIAAQKAYLEGLIKINGSGKTPEEKNAIDDIKQAFSRFHITEHNPKINRDAPFRVAMLLLHDLITVKPLVNNELFVKEIYRNARLFKEAPESYWYPASDGAPSVMEKVTAGTDILVSDVLNRQPMDSPVIDNIAKIVVALAQDRVNRR